MLPPKLCFPFAFAICALLHGLASGNITFRRVNEVKLNHAAVATFDYSFPETEVALIVTTFFPFGQDKVYAIPNVKDVFDGSTEAKLVAIDDSSIWPNQADGTEKGVIEEVPNSVFVLEAGGFFVSPSKATGSVILLDVTNPVDVRKIIISPPDKDFFYHHAVFVDINGDGRKDILAARAFKSLNPFAKVKAASNLVWFEQPETGATAGSWAAHQLTGNAGPGVGFTYADLDGDGDIEIIASQYFSAQQLSLWWCNGRGNVKSTSWINCVNGSNVESVVIDDDEGAPFFDVELVDLNNDGKKEILTSTNTNNGKGAIFAYEQPQGDVKTEGAKWIKHKLAEGYIPTKRYLPGRGAPGTAMSFFIHKNDTLPSILVSGDDAGVIDLLVPIEGQPFQYEKIRMVNSTGTIGKPSVGDLDGDGTSEVAIPLFAENKIAFYTFG